MSKLAGSTLLLSVTACVAACAGPAPMATVSFAPKTTLVPVSARCAGSKCSCRPLQGSDMTKETGILAGHKRFELRLPRSTAALWVGVAGKGVYYKPPEEVAPQCVTIDLEPGRHEVVVHGEQRDVQVGLQSGLTIFEYGEPRDGGPNWYRSFHFTCGIGASKCTREEIEIWRAFQRKLPRGVLDPCGSVMVKGAKFAGSRAQKGDEAYRDLTLRFAMKVYQFKPQLPAGSPGCKAPTKNR